MTVPASSNSRTIGEPRDTRAGSNPDQFDVTGRLIAKRVEIAAKFRRDIACERLRSVVDPLRHREEQLTGQIRHGPEE